MLSRGERVKFLPFWGHRPRADGRVGSECLSQWWPAEFVLDGRTFRTAEHYMMWAKAELFGAAELAEQVLAAGNPGAAKALGRRIEGFDEDLWAADRFEIVVTGNVAKFGQHDELRRFLLGTGDRVLVEASPVDRIWGIGMAADDERAEDPSRWEGANLLGFALMEARARLRGDSGTATAQD